MPRILVTGATGRVGANLVKALLGRGYEVRSYVMPMDPKKSKLDALQTEIAWGELDDLDSLRRAAECVDAVIHLACVMGRPPGMSKSSYFDVNVKGTYNVFEAVAERAKSVRRFIFASSDASYSAQNPVYLPMDEEHPQRPFFQYGLIKQLGENIVRALGLEYGIPVTILRFGTVMNNDEILRIFRARAAIGQLGGAGTHPASALYVEGIERPWEVIEGAVRDLEQLVIPRNLEGKSWLHHPSDVRDTIAGIILALENDAAVNQTLNILADHGTTWEEGVRYIADKTGEDFVEVQLPNYWAFECDVSKARRLLGYNPQHDYRRMVDDAIAYREGKDLGLIPS